MGSVIGVISEEQPPYTVVKSAAAYELRRYEPQVRVETEDADVSAAFRRLAAYIGVLSTPANVVVEGGAPQAIAMTAPVAMDNCKMAFVLPGSRYTAVEAAPVPTDPRVQLRLQPAKTLAVVTFAGSARHDSAAVKARAAALRKALEADGIAAADAAAYTFHGYNPPWTLPWYRTNEVAIEVAAAPAAATAAAATAT